MTEAKTDSTNPFTKERINRINYLKETIQKNPEMNIDQLMAKFVIETGSSPRRVREYLQTLVDSGTVELYQRGIHEYAKLKE